MLIEYFLNFQKCIKVHNKLFISNGILGYVMVHDIETRDTFIPCGKSCVSNLMNINDST